ncbi:teleost multiple tissue opsin 3a [Aplochiton taeniatus]
MVVHVRDWNFSTTESSFSYTNASVDIPQDPSSLTRTGHTIVAVCLGLILVLGILNNCLVLIIFAKFRSLWTPINLILLNISVSDILVCIFGTPFSFAASLQGKWLIGSYGCKWYGFANSLFGIVSLVSLSILSYERYTAVLHASKPDVSDFREAWLCVGGSWLYSLLWTLPPFLGWSSYGPEGAGTSCSVQWHQRSAASVSYVVCLFVFCLLLPLLLMVYCYGRILVAIRGVAKINLLSAQRREQHILLMVLSMVSCYLLCWMPYGVVALLATFGQSGLVTPVASVVPSILAKSSTVVNPVIYMLLNNQFYRCFVAFMKCDGEARSIHCFNTQEGSREEPGVNRV